MAFVGNGSNRYEISSQKRTEIIYILSIMREIYHEHSASILTLPRLKSTQLINKSVYFKHTTDHFPRA